MWHPRHGAPRAVIAAALAALGGNGMSVTAASSIRHTPPLGPSRRHYANAVAVVETGRGPAEVLQALLAIEAQFGRRRRGSAWQARVLDLDIVLWSGGFWAADDGRGSLVVPHPEFRKRRFVLEPAATIARRWRDPMTSLAVGHLTARLTKPRPTPT